MLSRAEVQNKANTLRLMITQNDNPSDKQQKQAVHIAFDLLTDAMEKLTVLAQDAAQRAARSKS